MPTLISEDLDEGSSSDTGSSKTEDAAVPIPANEHNQPAVSEPAPTAASEYDASLEQQDALVDGELLIARAPVSEDHALGEQLQRSAEEGFSDQDATEAVAPQTVGMEDVTMTDADAEAEPAGEELTEDTAAKNAILAQEDGHDDEIAALEDDAGGDIDIEQSGKGKYQNHEDAEGMDEQEEAEGEAEAAEAGGDSEQGSESIDNGDVSSASQSGSESGSASEVEAESSEENATGGEAEEAKQECIFCQQICAAADEDEDSNLTCSECGDRAHLTCAQDTDAVIGENTAQWQCPDCLKKTAQSESPKEQTVRSKNSAPRLVRDLLPVTRGVQKPNSHSIFAQPLISEGEDGGRALRKRKSPTQEPPTEKRRRKAADLAAAAAPPSIISTDSNTTAVAHSTRRSSLLRVTNAVKPTSRILQHRPFNKPPPHKFILAFRLDQSRIEEILDKPAHPGRRRERKVQHRKKEQKIPPPFYQPPVPKFPALPTHNLIFPSAFTDRETELHAKPYGGVLTDADADTSRSLPQLKDREIFEIARKEAEEERRRTSAAAEAEINGGVDAAVTPGAVASTAKPIRSTVSGPPSKIKCIQFGKHVIDTFYAAPYPEEYSHESRLFICEYCLKYLPSEFVAYRHKLKCPAKHPPGDEIYRDGTISVWEVDGRKKTEYCQCLCLMAKMFLGSKTLYYDVEPFLFYILTEYDEFGYHFVGYFSKEKRPASQNNVSCILVMPIHQRKGYATFLIDFSYLLTRIEDKEGSPEKPLSDMGLTAYRSYWDLTISRHLLDLGLKKPFSTRSLMARTGMTADDVIHSLERLYAFTKDPVTRTYAVRYDKKLYERIVNDFEAKGHRKMKPELLVWTPHVMGRSDQAHLDEAPLQALAPRSDDEGDEEQAMDADNEGAVSTKAEEGVAIDVEALETEPNTEQLSPKSAPESSKTVPQLESLPIPEAKTEAKPRDPALVDEHGHIAPGPPSTGALSGAISSHMATSVLTDVKINGTVNGDSGRHHSSRSEEAHPGPTKLVHSDHFQAPQAGDADQPELMQESPERAPFPPLSGYALAFRQHNIPPNRFQIDPPIPPSMLRQRSTKKRNAVTAFGGAHKANGVASPSMAAAPFIGPIRSSPRNAANSTASLTLAGTGEGSINGNGRGSASPKGPGTPVRRSGRRSGLANVVATLDGSANNEEEDAPAEEDDVVAPASKADDGEDAEGDDEDGDDQESSSNQSEEDEQEASVATDKESGEDEESEEEGDAEEVETVGDDPDEDDPDEDDPDEDEDEESQEDAEEEDDGDPAVDFADDDDDDEQDEDEDAEAEDDE